MPEKLTAEEVNSKTDPSVSKQWDTSTPRETQVDEFFKFADSMKVGLLTTMREGVGPVSRSMAIAKVCFPPSSLLPRCPAAFLRLLLPLPSNYL